MLSRTLLIGLGGTGVNVLRKFKNHFLKYYDREQRYVRLLGIDTTDQEETGDPRLANQEFLHLGNPPIGSAEIFQWRDQDPFRWVPRDMPAFNIASGAGQRRLIGHIAYFWRGADIASRIQTAMDSLYAADVSREFLGLRDGAQTRVFVVSSLCGGTGTGMFLDIGYMVRHIFAQQARQTVSFSLLFLPSAFRDLMNDPQFPNLQANGYAALQELNYYMQDTIEETELYSPIPGNPKIAILPKPFDVCFTLGSPDEMSRVLPGSRELYERTAEFLFSAVAFPQIQTQLVDYLAVNGRLSYATFGSFTIPLPKARYVERYLRDMGRELLEDVLSASVTAESIPSVEETLVGTGIDLLMQKSDGSSGPLGQLPEVKDVAYVLQDQVFTHATPGNQKDATKAISDEFAGWMSMRTAHLAKANESIAKITGAVEQRIEEQRRRLLRLDKGSLSTMNAFLGSVIGKIDSILASLAAFSLTSENEIFERFREDKSIFGMGGQTSLDRLNSFRAELTVAAQAQMGEDCRHTARTALGQLRNRLNETKSAIDLVLRNAPTILADFVTKSEKFLNDRRVASKAQNLIAAGIGQGAIPPDQYENDRIGLLQRCRSRMKLDALLDAGSRVNLDHFIDQLYAQTSGYVSERVQTAQLLDPEALRDGLNQAWTNLSLRAVPGAQRWIINRLFAPQDGPLRAEIKTIVDQWPGIANGTEFADPVDDSILSFLRVIGRFNVDEIIEVRQLKQAYDAKMRNPNDALFLNLPTHRSHDVVVQDIEGEKSKQYALAIFSGVLQEFGQSVKFAGAVLQPEIADPLERRNAVRDRLLNPDWNRKVMTALRKKRETLGSQPAFADFVHEQIELHYPASDREEESELERLIDHERSQALLYLRSLGVRKYLDAGGAE